MWIVVKFLIIISKEHIFLKMLRHKFFFLKNNIDVFINDNTFDEHFVQKCHRIKQKCVHI